MGEPIAAHGIADLRDIIAGVKRLCVLLLAAAPAFAQQPAPQPAKIQTLIITGQNGHDWRGTTPILRKTLEDTGRFEVRVTEEFRGAGPETLAPYDLVVLNYYEKKQPALRWGERADAALVNFVRAGKGLVVYHFLHGRLRRLGRIRKDVCRQLASQ